MKRKTETYAANLTCPLGHSWQGTETLKPVRRMARGGGRIFPGLMRIVTPERCPTCRNRWTRLTRDPATLVTV